MPKDNHVEYVLTMNSKQAKEINRAIDLLMRWKLKQPDIMSYMLLDINENVDDFCRRRESLVIALRDAMDIWKEDTPGNWAKLKDEEWHTLYNIYQAIRYQIHLAEHPDTKGVDSYPPMHFGGEPVPKCEWRTKE